MFTTRIHSTALVMLLAAAGGCQKSGPEIAPVQGRVTLDGQPLAQADITFQPERAQRASIGRTDGDGRYELAYKRGQPGAIVGEHTVTVEVSPDVVKNPPPIPARYAADSELHYRVEPGGNEFHLELKSDPK